MQGTSLKHISTSEFLKSLAAESLCEVALDGVGYQARNPARLQRNPKAQAIWLASRISSDEIPMLLEIEAKRDPVD